MKNVWIYILVGLIVILAVLVIATLPKNKTQDVAYTLKIADYNDRITLNYTLTVDGNVIDSSYDRNVPLTFVIGSGQVIPGFDKGVLGLTEGQTIIFTVSPQEGYGLANVYPYKQKVDLEKVLKALKQKTKKDLNADEIQGGTFYDLMGRKCIFDGYDKDTNLQNIDCQHHLAGKTLTFKVSVLKIEKYGTYNLKKQSNVQTNDNK